jgi:hypothetical protein
MESELLKLNLIPYTLKQTVIQNEVYSKSYISWGWIELEDCLPRPGTKLSLKSSLSISFEDRC